MAPINKPLALLAIFYSGGKGPGAIVCKKILVTGYWLIIYLVAVYYRLSLCRIPMIDHRYLSPTTHIFIVYLLLTTTIVWTHVITLPPSEVYHSTPLVSNNSYVKIH